MRPYLLLVDDDVDDLMLLKEALATTDNKYDVKEATNGRLALNFLRSLNGSEPTPCLIVLDMNMPVLDGREVLAIMKSDPHLKEIPVLLFTTSSNAADVRYAQQFNVELLTKPFNTNLLALAAKKIFSYCNA